MQVDLLHSSCNVTQASVDRTHSKRLARGALRAFLCWREAGLLISPGLRSKCPRGGNVSRYRHARAGARAIPAQKLVVIMIYRGAGCIPLGPFTGLAEEKIKQGPLLAYCSMG